MNRYGSLCILGMAAGLAAAVAVAAPAPKKKALFALGSDNLSG
ncbi:MAG: hypothetical protein ACOY37_04115 [Pseudomonadota bacterium]